jgi:hypothetical protein
MTRRSAYGMQHSSTPCSSSLPTIARGIQPPSRSSFVAFFGSFLQANKVVELPVDVFIGMALDRNSVASSQDSLL